MRKPDGDPIRANGPLIRSILNIVVVAKVMAPTMDGEVTDDRRDDEVPIAARSEPSHPVIEEQHPPCWRSKRRTDLTKVLHETTNRRRDDGTTGGDGIRMTLVLPSNHWHVAIRSSNHGDPMA